MSLAVRKTKQNHFVTQEFLLDADTETFYTPDIGKLEQTSWQHVFIYNHWMRGHLGHLWFADPGDNIHGPVRKCIAFTKANEFVMVRKNLGMESFPVALWGHRWYDLSSNHAYHPARIQGELYKVRPQQIPLLDEWMKNGHEFIRMRTEIIVPFRCVTYKTDGSSMVQTRGYKTVPSWNYIGINSFWEPLIDAGYLYSIVRKYPHTSPRIGDCFYYALLENLHSWSPDHSPKIILEKPKTGCPPEPINHNLKKS